MKVLSEGQSWETAMAAIVAGGFARHGHWTAYQPTGDPTYAGPTALGARPLTLGGAPTLIVFTDNGIPVHPWSPSPPEYASKDWQIVELDTAPAPLKAPEPVTLQEAVAATAPAPEAAPADAAGPAVNALVKRLRGRSKTP